MSDVYEAMTIDEARSAWELVAAVEIANGTRWEAQASSNRINIKRPSCGFWVEWDDAKYMNITPLKLVPEVPVEFVGANAEFLVRIGGGFDIVRLEVPRGSLGSKIDGKTFRCVEVTE